MLYKKILNCYVKQFNKNAQLSRRFTQLPPIRRGVLLLSKQELAFHGIHKNVTYINRDNFNELLKAHLSMNYADVW